MLALVAALRTPTVRLRYLRARGVLPDAEYEQLLATLGCAECGTPMVVRHLDAVAERFDETSTAVARTGLDLTLFPFAADITPAARPVAIDGSRALVDAGDHREAVFWIVATAARCQSALSALAPESARVREPGFRELVADLTGLRTAADGLARRDALLASVPSTDQTGAEIVESQPRRQRQRRLTADELVERHRNLPRVDHLCMRDDGDELFGTDDRVYDDPSGSSPS